MVNREVDDRVQVEAETVVALAQQFRGLKKRALELAEQLQVLEQGYLKPSDDEAIHQLWQAYWRSRSVLLAIIDEAYLIGKGPQSTEVIEEVLPAASDSSSVNLSSCQQSWMVLGVTAALILVDAARFVREEFHENEPVRRILDMPSPEYGIPAGSYSDIQKGLFSATHVWRMHHALEVFYTATEDMKTVQDKNGAVFTEAVQIAQNLMPRLEVSLASFVKLWAKGKIRRAAHSIGRDGIRKVFYALQEWVGTQAGDVSISSQISCLPVDIETQLRDFIQPGDVFVTRKEHALTNYFLPGYWPHAILYLGPTDKKLADIDDEHMVLEAQRDGVRVRSLQNALHIDKVCVLRPQKGQECIQRCLQRGLQHAGKAYDFDFDFTRSDRMVCTEVVYRAYEGDLVDFELISRTGRLTVSAEDLLRMALREDGFSLAAVYCGEQFVCGPEAQSIVAATL